MNDWEKEKFWNPDFQCLLECPTTTTLHTVFWKTLVRKRRKATKHQTYSTEKQKRQEESKWLDEQAVKQDFFLTVSIPPWTILTQQHYHIATLLFLRMKNSSQIKTVIEEEMQVTTSFQKPTGGKRESKQRGGESLVAKQAFILPTLHGKGCWEILLLLSLSLICCKVWERMSGYC